MQRGSHYCRGTYGDLACFLRRREVSISTGLEDNSIRTRSSGKGSSRELSGTLRGDTLPSQSDRRPNLAEKELSSICSRAPSVPGGYVCTPAHDSIIGLLCTASPPGVSSSTAGPLQSISSGVLATTGEALAAEGLSPAPEEASLCKRKGHFPTVTPSPKAASSVPP